MSLWVSEDGSPDSRRTRVSTSKMENTEDGGDRGQEPRCPGVEGITGSAGIVIGLRRLICWVVDPQDLERYYGGKGWYKPSCGID